MSSLVFTFHDPQNIETKFLRQVLPVLKVNFEQAFVSVTAKTIADNKECLEFLQSDEFFNVNTNPPEALLGDHYLAAFENALRHTKDNQILHLCTSDRLAFAILNYKKVFLTDTTLIEHPTLFCRSEKAWATHPRTYRSTEDLITKTGELLFNKTLDFAWCHVAINAKHLKNIIPGLTAKDLAIYGQIAFLLKDVVKIKEVDWLSWEDPFIFGLDTKKLKQSRENDPKEMKKRMGYAIPMMEYLFSQYSKLHS